MSLHWTFSQIETDVATFSRTLNLMINSESIEWYSPLDPVAEYGRCLSYILILSGTSLHLAASAGCLDVVDLLLSRGADLSIKNSRGKLAVEEAESHNWSEVTDLPSVAVPR